MKLTAFFSNHDAKKVEDQIYEFFCSKLKRQKHIYLISCHQYLTPNGVLLCLSLGQHGVCAQLWILPLFQNLPLGHKGEVMG